MNASTATLEDCLIEVSKQELSRLASGRRFPVLLYNLFGWNVGKDLV